MLARARAHVQLSVSHVALHLLLNWPVRVVAKVAATPSVAVWFAGMYWQRLFALHVEADEMPRQAAAAAPLEPGQ